MAGTGSAVRWDAEPSQTQVQAGAAGIEAATGAGASRTDLYGGLVGDMIDEIGQRLATTTIERPAEPVDFAHRVSVASGYLALAAGCLATALGISRLL